MKDIKKEAAAIVSKTAKADVLTGKAFVKEVQKQYVRKYADDMVNLLEDKRQLEKALKKLNEWIEKVEAGNFRVLEIYKRKMANIPGRERYLDEFSMEDDE